MTAKRPLRRIVIGTEGLRLGWRIALFLTLTIVAVTLAALIAFGPKGPPKYAPLRQFALFEAIHTAGIIAATVLMARIEHRPFGSYGLQPPRRLRLAAIGWAGGFAALSLLIALLYAAHAIAFAGLALAPLHAALYGLAWLGVFGMVGLAEEMADRGYLLAALQRSTGFWPAVLMSSALFTLMHILNRGESWLGLAQVFTAGIAFCILLRASGSLWASIGFHAAWDWAQSFFYGTADSGFVMPGHLLVTHPVGDPRWSGGADGPEGSLLAAPVFLAGPLVLAWLISRSTAAKGENSAG